MSKSQIIEKTKQLIPFFFLAVAIIVAYRVISSLDVFANAISWVWGVISPFFYGFLVAYIINIPCGSVQRLLNRSTNRFIIHRQRGLSVIIVLLAFLGIIALALSFIIPTVVDSILFFIDNLDMYWEGVVAFIDNLNSFGIFEDLDPQIIWTALGNVFADFSLETLERPWNAVMGFGNALFGGVIAFISSMYILVEKDKIKAFAGNLFRIFASKNTAQVTHEATFRLNKYFRQYIKTQTVDGLILGTMATIAMFFMGSPFALVLGIMLGVFNYIPMFGSIVATAIAILVIGFTQGFTMGAISAAVLIGIQQIDVHFIQPRLLGSSFKLSPLLVIISIIVGGAIAGMLGMILAIPVVALLKDIFDSTMAYYEQKKFGSQDDTNPD
ncbi:MAG: AI-2E family transporter [Defluviitaleaceae bacterium]|nr:AI-2E family transporter [Defluviitaleaceae bacterium]